MCFIVCCDISRISTYLNHSRILKVQVLFKYFGITNLFSLTIRGTSINISFFCCISIATGNKVKRSLNLQPGADKKLYPLELKPNPIWPSWLQNF